MKDNLKMLYDKVHSLEMKIIKLQTKLTELEAKKKSGMSSLTRCPKCQGGGFIYLDSGACAKCDLCDGYKLVNKYQKEFIESSKLTGLLRGVLTGILFYDIPEKLKEVLKELITELDKEWDIKVKKIYEN